MAHTLTFVITTYDDWSEDGIDAIADEFVRMYDGNMAVDSANLEKVEIRVVPTADPATLAAINAAVTTLVSQLGAPVSDHVLSELSDMVATAIGLTRPWDLELDGLGADDGGGDGDGDGDGEEYEDPAGREV
jgi:hypothetical protein